MLLRETIQAALLQFSSQSLPVAATSFWKSLGYQSELTLDDLPADFAGLRDALGVEWRGERLFASSWNCAHFLFQITSEELRSQNSLFGASVEWQSEKSYLFFALDLKPRTENLPWSRGQLAQIAREMNRPFGSPILLLVRHDQKLTLAVVDRRAHKKDAGREVLEKVTLVKDIDFHQPHAGHLRILEELYLPSLKAGNWDELHREWKRVLDLQELNRKFFRELSDWYFYARHQVVFPQPKTSTDSPETHASLSVIRLLTRVMFAYFLKERDLVPRAVFDKSQVQKLLVDASPHASSYYKAVLQNLFFATLNTAIGERAWKPKSSGGYNAGFMVHNLRRYAEAFSDLAAAEKLFARVPFLNGGLFECLDRRDNIDGKETDVRYDGFSEHKNNPLSVPNALFWGEAVSADLNHDYGTKNKQYQVRPLLEIFGRYKFTVAENTPLEEEVALDPELLGKVFENLLASYNPETASTARKQTGSFYTPREIVDYMVEESLVAYLENAVPTVETATLRALFSPSESEAMAPELDLPARRTLIEAIENLTILDPACGSGAFPMGALHRLVELLQKLDPDNQLWRAQLEKSARALELEESRAAALASIAEVFERDSGDYARKLYLIEKCLFGVDIQPIAIQIAKLRFFIALSIEQECNGDAAQNFGIRPLPNLETKLVAANTLLGLASGDIPITNATTDDLQYQLEQVRSDHFRARSWKKKKELRARDARLRAELAAELADIGMAGGAAQQLASWNPYDQNASAGFFDPRWMFGIENGFGIVIGNPPYVFARDSAAKGQGMSKEAKDYYYANYSLAEYQVNLYPIFIEAGQRALKANGALCFITPNNWLTLNTNKKLRVFVLNQARVSILNFYARVFESADVDAAIVLFQKGNAESKTENVRLFEWITKPELIADTPKSAFLAQSDAVINIEALKSGETGGLMATVEKNTRPLSQIADVRVGLKAYQTGKGKPPQTVVMKQGRVFHSRQPNEGFIKYLEGRDVCRYRLGWGGEYLKYGPFLAEPRGNFGLFSTPRILVRQIPSPPPYCINACFTSETLLNDLNSMNIINISVAPQLVLAVLNSRLISYWFVHKFGKMQRGIFPQFKVNELAIFPMPLSFAPDEKTIIDLVETILAAKKADAGAATLALEAQIDELVYALYGLSPDEIALVEGN